MEQIVPEKQVNTQFWQLYTEVSILTELGMYRMSNLPDSSCCRQILIYQPDSRKIKRLRGPIFSINNFSTILHIWTMSNGMMNVIQIQRYTSFKFAGFRIPDVAG